MGQNFKTVAISGVGLIGGSLGLAIKKFSPQTKVVGIGRDESKLAAAAQMGCLDEFGLAPSCAAGADLIVSAMPVGLIVDDLLALAAQSPSALLTDAGSTKGEIVRELAARLPRNARFIGGHPMAGSEKGGAQFAKADLFVGSRVILTPTEDALPEDVCHLSEWWRLMGAEVHSMEAAEHDVIVASISHVPHVVAALIAGATPQEALPFASSGWRSTCRVAGGDPALWRQILMANRQEIARGLATMEGSLKAFREALLAGDAGELEMALAQGKAQWDASSSPPSSPQITH